MAIAIISTPTTRLLPACEDTTSLPSRSREGERSFRSRYSVPPRMGGLRWGVRGGGKARLNIVRAYRRTLFTGESLRGDADRFRSSIKPRGWSQRYLFPVHARFRS